VERLEHDAERAAAEAGELLLARDGEIEAAHADRAGVGTVDAADQVEERRLAAAGGADDGDELAGGDGREMPARARTTLPPRE
jgi:hypothetical protein